MNFDCNETFYWNQRSRKPKRAHFGDRHIKVIFGTRQPHFRVIFLANFLDTRWSQRGATLTNVFRKGVKRAAKGSKPPIFHQENYSKVRLTRAKYDFDVSVPKISPFRFSTTLISVEYLITVEIHRPGHHPP